MTPALDSAAVAALLHAIHPDDEGVIEVRIIDDHATQRWYSDVRSLMGDLPELHRRSLAGAAVCFGVLKRREEGSGKAADALPGAVLWADLDFKDYDEGEDEARHRLGSFPYPPSAIVRSGNGLHAYWLLAEPGEPAELEVANRHLAWLLNGDAVGDRARVMRLPGTVNAKDPNEPKPVEIETLDLQPRHRLRDFQSAQSPWSPPATEERLQQALNQIEATPHLRELWHGTAELPGDNSSSGHDFSLIRELVHRGLIDPKLLANLLMLRPSSKAAQRPDYARRTVDKALRSASTELVAGLDEAREHETPPVFPEEAWLGLFAEYRSLLQGTTESSMVFAWGALAAALSALVGRRAALAWGTSKAPPTLQVCLLGPTAKARKSTALSDVIDIVVARTMPGRPDDDAPEPFVVLRGLGSGEGFAEALADTPWTLHLQGSPPQDRTMTGRTALYVVDELGALLEKVGRKQAGQMVDFMIAMFDARKEYTHRTRLGSSTPALTVTRGTGVFLTASTETWLRTTLTEALIRQGLVNRFLWLTGSRGEPLHRREEIPADTQEEFAECVRTCLRAAHDQDFRLTPAADALHKVRYERFFHATASSDIEDAAVARKDQHALRLAMLLAFAEETIVIDEHHVRAAWAVADYSARVAASLVRNVEVASVHEAQDRIERSITRFVVERSATFTKRDIFQRLKGRSGIHAELFNKIFGALVEVGLIVEVGKQRFRWAGGLGDRGTPTSGAGGPAPAAPHVSPIPPSPERSSQ